MALQLFETAIIPPPDEQITGYALVALEQSLDMAPDGLTYAIGCNLTNVQPGDRVLVPLGKSNKPTPGYVTALTPTCQLKKIKFILKADPQALSLTTDLLDLAKWISSYYCCPLGMVFVSMLPAAVKKGTGLVMQKYVGICQAGKAYLNHKKNHHAQTPDSDQGHTAAQTSDQSLSGADCKAGPSPSHAKPIKLTPLQKKILEAAQTFLDQGKPLVLKKQLADQAGARTTLPIKELLKKGLLIEKQHQAMRDASLVPDPNSIGVAKTLAQAQAHRLVLNHDQHQAVEKLVAKLNTGFSTSLLHGVTGSGKTEVYLRVIEKLLEKDPTAGVIVLVPEIALTEQTVSRFAKRFGSVAVLHSGISASKRNAQWRAVRQGKAHIVIGARSAVFAPVNNLQLVIVDEEHESSYKQDQLPRYHARDVAIKRAQQNSALVILGSATPSLESYFNATHRHVYQLIELPSRVAGLKLPRVHIVDMTTQRQQRKGIHLISLPLEKGLNRCLAQGKQAMLLLNRRGYANYIACPDHRCGWIMTCQFCDVSMVYHKNKRLPTGGSVQCHHCKAKQLLPSHCPTCQRKVTVFGIGTQRVEEELKRKFPNAVAVRMDSDTMRNSSDYQKTLSAFGRGEIDILVGTQMIAKGLDFPNVTLVGVISADTALHMPDFRSCERTFSLIAQVAGRAGRPTPGHTPNHALGNGQAPQGQVFVQTYNPDQPVIQLAAQHDYVQFATEEIKLRIASNLPPHSRLARLVLRDRDHDACLARSQRIADGLKKQCALLNDATSANEQPIAVLGPTPAPVARIAEYHRMQILIFAASAAPLQSLLATARNAKLFHADSKHAVDVDPVMLM